MNWISRLERKYGRFCIPNLISIIVGGQILVYAIELFVNQFISVYLGLSRSLLLMGQVWRLITFVFIPFSGGGPLSVILGIYFTWFIGTALEKEWGELFPRVFQTITVDNGSEFADCPGIERSILAEGSRTKCYYCHPYSSWERGSNENLNRMIRRKFPKGTSFADVTRKQVQNVEDWMNNYPRKVLGYLTAEMAYQTCVAAL